MRWSVAFIAAILLVCAAVALGFTADFALARDRGAPLPLLGAGLPLLGGIFVALVAAFYFWRRD